VKDRWRIRVRDGIREREREDREERYRSVR
jgi:hypothetical protein